VPRWRASRQATVFAAALRGPDRGRRSAQCARRRQRGAVVRGEEAGLGEALSDQPEQLTGFPWAECRRLQAGMAQQVAVAADDCLGACLSGKSDEVVILGIAQDCLYLDGSSSTVPASAIPAKMSSTPSAPMRSRK
jgi:hypothetical protein